MLRQEYLRRLVDNAYIDIFLAGVDGARIYWPWRMARDEDSLSRSYRDACEVYWVDSKIGDESYGNQDVLDDAYAHDAEGVLLADTIGDFKKTVTLVKKGLDMADDHVFDGDVIIPLQAPFDKCYDEFSGESEYYAIGGLKDELNDSVRVDAAKTVRELAGYEIHLHGLGWGVRDGLAKALQDDPELINSVDSSTPVQSSIDAHPGEERTSVTAMKAGTILIQQLRLVSDYVDVDPPAKQRREPGQTGLTEL